MPKPLCHGQDIVVLEHRCAALLCPSHGDVDHHPCQVIRADYLTGKQPPKYGIDRAQESVAEIGLLPRLHGIDVGGAKDVSGVEPRGEKCVLRLTLVACEGDPTFSRRVRPLPAQEYEFSAWAARVENPRKLNRVIHGYRAELSVRRCAGTVIAPVIVAIVEAPLNTLVSAEAASAQLAANSIAILSETMNVAVLRAATVVPRSVMIRIISHLHFDSPNDLVIAKFPIPQWQAVAAARRDAKIRRAAVH